MDVNEKNLPMPRAGFPSRLKNLRPTRLLVGGVFFK